MVVDLSLLIPVQSKKDHAHTQYSCVHCQLSQSHNQQVNVLFGFLLGVDILRLLWLCAASLALVWRDLHVQLHNVISLLR